MLAAVFRFLRACGAALSCVPRPAGSPPRPRTCLPIVGPRYRGRAVLLAARPAARRSGRDARAWPGRCPAITGASGPPTV